MAQAVASTHRATRRTILKGSPELQLILLLVAKIGVDGVVAAEALIAARFRFEAAVLLLQMWACGKCGWTTPMRLTPEAETPLRDFLPDPSRSTPPQAKCPRCRTVLDYKAMCPATLRQRIHRIQKRVKEVLGPAFEVQKRRRAAVHYGAEESGVFRMAAAPSEAGE